MANKWRTLHAGVTNDLQKRVCEHKHRMGSRFTSKYSIDRLVYFEVFPGIRDAIARQTQIKGWFRTRNIALIGSVNPKWEDLSANWYR